jgi:AraC-like DNA-binding protein
MINLHSVIAFFHNAEWTELAITHEINRVLGENRIADSTVGKSVREFVCGPKDNDSFTVRQFEGDFTLDDRIGSVFAEAPFLSLRQIAKRVMMSESTVSRHLTSGMGWRLKHLRWVPHRPTDVEKVT